AGTLLIDGVQVVNNVSNATATGTITLAAGFHAVEARLVQITGGGGAILKYSGPDTGNTPPVSPATALVPVSTGTTVSGLFLYSGSTAAFTNNVTVSAGATGGIDGSNTALDATLGTLTFAGAG